VSGNRRGGGQRGSGGSGGQRGSGGGGQRGSGGRGGSGRGGPHRGKPSTPGRLPNGGDQLEGRNVVYEALARKRRKVRRIRLDERAKPNEKLAGILAFAAEMGVPVARVPRETLDRDSFTGVHNGILAEADPLPENTVRGLLADCANRGEYPFVVLVDEVQYEHNLGAILRSALGAGVHAVIVPTRRGKGLTPVVQRVAMGGAEEVELIREGLSSALATLRRAGVRVVGADMDGAPCWATPMTGPLAVVLGGEDKGLSQTLRERCDAIVSVPLSRGLDSLNVSVTAGVLLFEKVRQEAALQ
jgi:23S rRNA (guanosine2251-2'-O)-methyltransferase